MRINAEKVVALGSFVFGAIGLVLEGKDLIAKFKVDNAKKLTK